MENIDNKITISDFLFDKNAKEIFANLDYLLKDGMHFQKQGKQVKYFKFIDENFTSLRLYYRDFFNVELTEGGEKPRNYFYLDFYGNKRGNISPKHRYILNSEYVIIGFIIYKILFIDNEVDLDSVQKLKEKIRNDYIDYKDGIYRLIAKSRNTTPGNLNDDAIDSTVQTTLEEFKKIGWIELDKDEFNPLPAFDRLIKIYEEYILKIDETLNELK
ncbi:condensin complex protein MksE [Tenacibaculum maritimum]|uniref:condensin complex protein MksE n=2 Tax=Tenacibaculum maritimum TaxID=107401 RepID=UPI00388FE251